jgi:hypothetical protein
MSTATAFAIEPTASASRLVRVRELWESSRKSQLEIGRLLYEERAERRSVGGRGVYEGFHQWLREAGIPKASAYRRIAEYEVSIGERVIEDTPCASTACNDTASATACNDAPNVEDTLTEKPVSSETTFDSSTLPRIPVVETRTAVSKTPSLEVLAQCIRRFGDCSIRHSKGVFDLEMKLIGLAPSRLAIALEAFNAALGSCDDACIDESGNEGGAQ